MREPAVFFAFWRWQHWPPGCKTVFWNRSAVMCLVWKQAIRRGSQPIGVRRQSSSSSFVLSSGASTTGKPDSCDAYGLADHGAGYGVLCSYGLGGSRFATHIGATGIRNRLWILRTFGGFSLMTVMSLAASAVPISACGRLLFCCSRASGRFSGGALRDLLLLVIELPAGTAYALVFVVIAAGLASATFWCARMTFSASRVNTDA